MLIYYNLERSKYIKRKGLFDIHLPKGQETESKPLNFSRPIIQRRLYCVCTKRKDSKKVSVITFLVCRLFSSGPERTVSLVEDRREPSRRGEGEERTQVTIDVGVVP